MDHLNVSVIICTHNRSHLVNDALSSLNRVDYPSQACEILVIDNASTDDTREVCQSWSEVLNYQLRYIYEGKLGLSNARNTGALAARNEIIVYVDDDEYFEPDWLTELVRPFVVDVNVVCSGGRIDLFWEVSQPEWLPKNLEGLLGSNHHLGDQARLLGEKEFPFGGNLAFRREALLKVGGFDPQFGRVGSSLGANEEARVVDMLRPLGKIAYNPEAFVHHRVPPWRAKKGYFLRRGFYQGIANANLEQMSAPASRYQLLRSAAVDILLSTKLLVKYLRNWISQPSNPSFEPLVDCIAQIGHFYQSIRIALKIS